MLTLLVPNAFGGESGGELGADSHIAQALRGQGYNAPMPLRMPTYWGEQPFTSGPVYLGAIVCFLAILSLFVVKSKYNWCLFGASVFFMLLAMGKNALWINDFLFHYLPMYNKFRTPSMALVMLQVTCAIMAGLSLKTIATGDFEEKDMKQSVFISAGLCAALLFVPLFFLGYSCSGDAGYAQQYGAWFTQALSADRADLATSDAFRSFWFIAITAGLLLLVLKKKDLSGYAMVAIAALSLFDLWGVATRYCGEGNYVNKLEYKPYQPSVANQAILQDADPSYRVLTFNNPFNDTHVPYFHKSIGGYCAAKLRDYQDLIEQHIEPEMQHVQASFRNIRSQQDVDSVFLGTPVLNMLNMRYLIYNDGAAPLKNSRAMGNAWFVKNYKLQADTIIAGQAYSAADLQMKMLGTVNLAETALVEKQFEAELAGRKLGYSEGDDIQLLSYQPNKLVYKTKTATDALAVFSEMYYPLAWNATIDGKPAAHFRTDWILRGMVVPAGEHTVEFHCDASTYWTFRNIGSIVSLLLLLALVGVLGYCSYEYFKKDKASAAKG